MKKVTIFIILFNCFCLARAQYPTYTATAEQVQHSQELIDKETLMLERIQQGDKFFIKKIVISGFTLINKTELKDIFLTFQGHWLTKDDLQRISDEITQIYLKKGYNAQPKDISFHIKGKVLEIAIDD